jgi:PAS domain S-box-containing protein
VESSDDAIVGKSLEGIISSWNQGATRLFGYLPDEAIGRPITMLIPSDRQDEERMIIERIRRGERIDHYETIRRRKDGSLVPISLTISPVRDGAGRIVGASKIARDISERKQKEEHIALLSREVAHRSKNLLALVTATVRLAQGETPEALKKAIVGRIQALANAHALLEQSHWAGADLCSLVAQELSPYAPDGEARAALSGPRLLLKPKSAQTFAVVLHELTTNAVKYGSLSVPTGRIQVEWSFAPDGRLVIVWTETGGPPVELPTRRGLGTLVIEQAVKGELQGDAQVDWRREGLVCRLTVNPAIEF